MNSKFKFRIWDKKYSRWRKDSVVLNLAGEFLNPINLAPMTRSNDFVIQQFTGLLDKNNKEIFEGDIVRLTNPAHWTPDLIDETWVKQESVVVKVVQARFGEYHGQTTSSSWISLSDYKIWEVIGNIYENPKIKLQ